MRSHLKTIIFEGSNLLPLCSRCCVLATCLQAEMVRQEPRDNGYWYGKAVKQHAAPPNVDAGGAWVLTSEALCCSEVMVRVDTAESATSAVQVRHAGLADVFGSSSASSHLFNIQTCIV